MSGPMSVKDVIQHLNSKLTRLEQRVARAEERTRQLEEELTTLREQGGAGSGPTTRFEPELRVPRAPVTQLKPTPAPTPPPPPPGDIPPKPGEPDHAPQTEYHRIHQSLLDDKGKFKFNHLKHYAVTHGKAKFISVIRYPVLVGSGLFRGMVVENPNAPSEMGGTVMFQALIPNQEVSADKVRLMAMERSIYPLLKKSDLQLGEVRLTLGGETTISIGRAPDNDIVMEDPSISQHQAEIRLSLNADGVASGYFLRDMGSTNGIYLNDRKLAPYAVEEIKPGDEIKLGRFFFSFTAPLDLFEKLIND